MQASRLGQCRGDRLARRSSLTAARREGLRCAAAATCRAGCELDARWQAVQDPRRQAPDECSEDNACASAFRADLGIGQERSHANNIPNASVSGTARDGGRRHGEGVSMVDAERGRASSGFRRFADVRGRNPRQPQSDTDHETSPRRCPEGPNLSGIASVTSSLGWRSGTARSYPCRSKRAGASWSASADWRIGGRSVVG